MTCWGNRRKGNEGREKLEKESRETYVVPKRSCITCGSFETIIVSPSVCVGEGNGTPLQYSYLENPKDRGTW